MRKSTKSAIKQSEADLQKEVVKYIRLVMPDAKIIANPFSELQLPGSEQYRWKVLGNAKAKGWEKSQPDLIVLTSLENFAIEIKTEENDPFRPYRGGGMWITHSKSEQVDHVLAQAKYLHDLRQKKGFNIAMFGAGFDQCKEIINHALAIPEDEKYQVGRIKLDGGKYTPEEFYLPFLAKK
jgi:hypothetical protein